MVSLIGISGGNKSSSFSTFLISCSCSASVMATLYVDVGFCTGTSCGNGGSGIDDFIFIGIGCVFVRNECTSLMCVGGIHPWIPGRWGKTAQ